MKGDEPMPHSADDLPAGVVVHRDLAYVSGGHPRQVLDLYLPPGARPVPLIVWIHGGAFRMGDKGDRVPFEMLEQGYAIASLNYRLSQHALFPAQIEDCKAAVRWLRAHADTYGLDPAHCASWGESAGGHLAAATLLRLRDRHAAAHRFLGANLVFGVFDLTQTPSQTGVGAGPDILDPPGMLAAGEMFVPGTEVADRRAPDLSPLYADLTGMPPALFTAGTADHLVDDTLFMAARWELSGNHAEMLLYPDGPHGCTMLPSVSAHWNPRLLDFFRACLKD